MTLESAINSVKNYASDKKLTLIFLEGDLGAGKTHFVNQFAESIEYAGRLPSPTFTFLQVYKHNWESYKRIVHCDFYRIEKDKSEKTLEQIGFWDYVEEGSIVFIEWPSNVSPLLDEIEHKTLNITLTETGERDYELS